MSNFTCRECKLELSVDLFKDKKYKTCVKCVEVKKATVPKPEYCSREDCQVPAEDLDFLWRSDAGGRWNTVCKKCISKRKGEDYNSRIRMKRAADPQWAQKKRDQHKKWRDLHPEAVKANNARQNRKARKT